jgi:hypothetical protein
VCILRCLWTCCGQADLAAIWHILEAVLRWRAAAAAAALEAGGDAAAAIPATQTALLLEAGLRCNLQHVTQVRRAQLLKLAIVHFTSIECRAASECISRPEAEAMACTLMRSLIPLLSTDFLQALEY